MPTTRLNRAVGVNFEPGSVFKVGVVAAALNEGLIATNDLFDCENGMWFYAGRPLRDFHPYGMLDVTGILRKSSNIGAAKIAVMLGAERLYRYLSAYGLGGPRASKCRARNPASSIPLRKWAKLDITRIAMGHERRRDGAADAERAVLHRQRRVPDEDPSRPQGGGQERRGAAGEQARGAGPAHHRAHRAR